MRERISWLHACTHLSQNAPRVVARLYLLLAADTGTVDVDCKALVYVPIEVELLDELFGVGERRGVLVRFEAVEERSEGRGGEGVPGLGEGV